jgi:ABC-type Fe3+-hydroxamate transport system substrate-binding protein
MVGTLAVPMLRSLPLFALAAAVLVAGCTTQSSSNDDSTSKFRGDQRLVANTVEDFESAASKGDQDKICRDLLAKALVQQYAQHGGTCEKAVDATLKDTDSFNLTVERVTISGQQANATVKADRGKKDINQALTLVKQGAGWRISAFEGR